MNKRLGRAGFVTVTLGALGCGDPAAPELRPQELFRMDVAPHDSLRGDAWRKYLKARELHAAWVPPAKSPWRPYYKPTLAAAVSIVQSAARPVRDRGAEAVEAEAGRFAEATDLRGAAVFVDLAGEHSVAWGAALQRRGFQPVVTINNWPHQFGMLRLERALGAMLYYAEESGRAKPPELAPPVFILEGLRLSQKRVDPTPGVFDNRFFHAAGDFPAAEVFRARGIVRIYYVTPRHPAAGGEEDDLNEYFAGLAAAGLQFFYVSPASGNALVVEVKPARRTTIFSPAETAAYSGSRPYGRPYRHYHHYFWSRSSGGGGGGGSGFTS